MTRAMKRLLREAQKDDCIFMGGWGSGQHNRPARKLEALGLLEFGWIPEGSMLKMQGWKLTEQGRAYK